MIEIEFSDVTEADVTQINSETNAALYTEAGISTHSKFVLLEVAEKRQYPRIIFQNLSEQDKEKLFELLDKKLHKTLKKTS